MNTQSTSWLPEWNPNDPEFWDREGKQRAWRTLAVTTFALTLAFCAWFVVSAIVVKLKDVGFTFSREQLFWLTAMPGLAAGLLRIAHMFLVPIFGSRKVITLATLSLLIPTIGWGIAVQNPQTPYWVLIALAFAAGLGGGNFSSFMPSTSLFFPKRLQGTALGIQAGIGNFGVSVVQFLTPLVMAANLFFFAPPLAKQLLPGRLWLQNALWIYVPLLLAAGLMSYLVIRSVPITANLGQQFTIFRDKHTWVMTSIYMMSFGVFSGLSAAFPLMIQTQYGHFAGAPLPLTYAFLGPLVGSSVRILFGFIADKTGGAILTTVSAIGMTLSAVAVTFFMNPTSLTSFPWFVTSMLALFFFSGIGNASTFRQMPVIFNPPKSAGVIGWTAAIAAFGPFIVSISISASPLGFFYVLAVFCVFNLALNWWFYNRKGAEAPC